MNSLRIEQLKLMMDDEPSEPFYVYALALEYMNHNRVEALELLKKLLSSNPNYLPAYYQAGLLSIELGEVHETEIILVNGISLARKNKELKTENELQSLLDNL